MQNIAFPSPRYQGCTVRGLPVSLPFRIQCDVQGGGNKMGIFIMLPYQINTPGTHLVDFTKEVYHPNKANMPSNTNMYHSLLQTFGKVEENPTNGDPVTVTEKTNTREHTEANKNDNTHPSIETTCSDVNSSVLGQISRENPIPTNMVKIKSCKTNEDGSSKSEAGQDDGDIPKMKKPKQHNTDKQSTIAMLFNKSPKILTGLCEYENVSPYVKTIKCEPDTGEYDGCTSIKYGSAKVVENDQSVQYEGETDTELAVLSTMVVEGEKTETYPDSVMCNVNQAVQEKSNCIIQSCENGNFETLCKTECSNNDQSETKNKCSHISDHAYGNSEDDQHSVLPKSNENPKVKKRAPTLELTKYKGEIKTETGLESEPVIKRKRKHNKEVNADLFEIQKLKMVKIKLEDGEVNEGSVRKSTRLRSVGFRPDYQDVENKIDEVLEYLEIKVEPDDEDDDDVDSMEKCTKEQNQSDENVSDEDGHAGSNKAESLYDPLESSDSESSVPDEIEIEDRIIKKRQGKIGKVRNRDTSGKGEKKPETKSITHKLKSIKHGTDDSETESGSCDRDEYNSNECDDESCVTKKKVAKKQMPKKERILVKLEEHKDKYTMDIYSSIARKDRGKSVMERTEEVYVCTLCNNYTSQAEEGMESHLENHLNGELDCTKCDFTACNAGELFEHRIEAHKKNSQVCPECGLEVCFGGYKNHMGKIHNKPLYECVFCRDTVGEPTWHLTAFRFQKHKEENHRDVGFSCKLCNKFFLKKDQWKEHENSCRGKEVSKCCDKCGLKLANSASLKSHTERVHLKIRRFQCPQCPFAASKRCILNNHKLVHQGKNVHSM